MIQHEAERLRLRPDHYAIYYNKLYYSATFDVVLDKYITFREGIGR